MCLRNNLILAAVCGIALLPSVSASPESLRRARDVVGEWVEVEKTLSKEALEWERKATLMRDRMEVLRSRIGRLEKQLREAESEASEADAQRRDLLEEETALLERGDRVRGFLAELENGLRELKPRLPRPLREEVTGLFQRMPPAEEAADRKDGDRNLGERMRTAITLVTRILEFDNRVTVAETVRRGPESEREAVFRTLWLGLGQAYYVTPDDAGFGTPGAGGWEWHSRPELAKRVREAMRLAEGSAVEPRFFTLPVRIGKEAAK